MDLKFDPSLSAAEWLNKQFEAPEARNNVEGFAAELLTNLQQQLYKSQQGLDELLQQLPRLGVAVSRSQSYAVGGSKHLINDVGALQTRLEESVGVSNDAVRSIRAMEIVKQRMELSYRSLENQDNWEALIANIKDVISSGDLDAISARIIALQKCYVSLNEAANHENRRNQLAEVKNSIESVMIPRLITTLSVAVPWKSGGGGSASNENSVAQKIIHLFVLMVRTETLKRVLKECRHKQFVKHFEDITKPLEVSESDTSIDECISSFSEDILCSWHIQLPLFAMTFPDPANALLQHYTDIITAVNPRVEKLLDSAWKASETPTSAQDFLATLLEIRRSQEVFAQTLDKDYQASHPRGSVTVDLLNIVRTPLLNWLVHYPEVERVIVMAEVGRVQLDDADLAKSMHVLSTAGTRLGSTFYAAVVRCFQLTDGKSLKPILGILEEAVVIHMEKVEDLASVLLRNATTELKDVMDLAESNCEVLNELVKVLHHGGDLILQLDNLEESLKMERPASGAQEHFFPQIQIIKRSTNTIFNQTLAVILQPVDKLMDGVCNLSAWTSSGVKGSQVDIPSFGLDPQEYVTRIGNYLLTLPQVVDPLLSSESQSMQKLKHILMFPGVITLDDSLTMAEAWIHATVFSAMEKVCSGLVRIKHITSFGIRQMICDLRYLQNVVDDFAVPLSANFSALNGLLTASPEEFFSRSANCPVVVVQFVKKARNFD